MIKSKFLTRSTAYNYRILLFIILSVFFSTLHGEEKTTPTPIMSLDFSGMQNASIKDSCGNFDAKLFGAIKAGEKGGAKFDGISSYIKINSKNNSGFKFPSEYSVAIRFTPSEKQSNMYPKILSAPGSWVLHITKEPPFILCLNIFDSKGKIKKQLATRGLKAGQPTELSFTIDEKNVKLYTNGKLADSFALDQSIPTPKFPILVGNKNENAISGIFSGTIDNLSVYSEIPGQNQDKCDLPSLESFAQSPWNAEWIWDKKASKKEMSSICFRKEFDIAGDVKSAWLKITSDDKYELYLNGKKLAANGGWVLPELYEVTEYLHKGSNIIAAKVHNFMGPGGLLAELKIICDSGKQINIATDKTWKCAPEENEWHSLKCNDTNWVNSTSLGKPPTRPWGQLEAPQIQSQQKNETAMPSLAKTLEKIKTEPALTASVKMVNGAPSLFINGSLKFPMLGKDIHLDRKFVNEYSDNGIHLYIPAWPYVGLLPDNKHDYSELDAYALTTLSADPDAYMMFFVSLNPADFWNKLNPDELCVFSDGSKAKQSLASLKWKEEFGKALEKFIEHIQKSPYGKRVFGIIVEATLSEWQYWGVDENKFPDYSKPAQAAFRKWLRAKYKNVENLKKAWNTEKIKTFDDIKIPTQKKRSQEASSAFLPPNKHQDVIDYLRCHSETVADAIMHFAKILKNKTENKLICGTFYGYLLEHSGMGKRLPHGGHLALRKVLDCPSIDFVASPVSYRLRKPGECGAYMIPKDSVYLHKKMLLHEADMRTFLSSKHDRYSRAANVEDTIAVLKREFAKMLTDGIGLWWYDMRGGWFSDKSILDFFKEASLIGQKSLSERNILKSEIAVIVDEKTPCLMSLGMGTVLNNQCLSMQRNELSRIGAPFDTYILSDLLSGEMPDYKMYIFLNAFYASDKEREIIKTKLQKDNHTILWLYAPGFINENELSAKFASELTGINLNAQNKATPLSINISTDKFEDSPKGNVAYGIKEKINPTIFINDPQADILGCLTGSKLPGLGIKKFPNWTSVYSSAPRIPAWLLRNLAKKAGVFIYMDSDDIIFLNKDHLAIHTASDGEKTLRLKSKTNVYELFENKFYGKNTDTIQFKSNKNKTIIFKLEN